MAKFSGSTPGPATGLHNLASPLTAIFCSGVAPGLAPRLAFVASASRWGRADGRPPSDGLRNGSIRTSAISLCTKITRTASREAASPALISRTRASASGRAETLVTASWCCWPIRICCWSYPRRVSWLWLRLLQINSLKSLGSKRLKARPGTIRCWSRIFCWCATPKKWQPSGCPSRKAKTLSTDYTDSTDVLLSDRKPTHKCLPICSLWLYSFCPRVRFLGPFISHLYCHSTKHLCNLRNLRIRFLLFSPGRLEALAAHQHSPKRDGCCHCFGSCQEPGQVLGVSRQVICQSV